MPDREASRKSREFFANMSHAMRTPLNSVIGFAEMIHDAKAGAVTDLQKEFLDDILASSRHLLQLVDNVLDLSKVDAGTMEFQPETVDASALVCEVMGTLTALSTARKIPIEPRISPLCRTVTVDPGRLKQVLYNYLSNALKFTPDGGRVVVRLLPEGPDEVRLEVEDSGVGISGYDQAKLFVDFQQLETPIANGYAGTGLGLALTKRIVEAQGGSVGVNSTPGAGSTFFAVIPQAHLEPARVATQQAEARDGR